MKKVILVFALLVSSVLTAVAQEKTPVDGWSGATKKSPSAAKVTGNVFPLAEFS